MYQEYYQNDQFQIQEVHSNINQSQQLQKSTVEQELEAFINKESILPKILNRQKSASQYQSLNQRKKGKKKIALSKTQGINSVPKKSLSQYSIVKRKSRSNRYQSLDINKSKTFQKVLQSSQSIKHEKRKSQAENVKLKNQISITKKIISLRNSNQINRKLTLNNMNQKQVNKIQHYFGHTRSELQELNDDQLNRLNNRLHDWIDKFNKKIDALLEKKVAQQVKTKSSENNSQKIKQILEKHIMINNDLLRRMLDQNKKLQSKNGQMKEEQYEFLLDKQVERLITKIKEEAKSIIQYKKNNQLSAAKIINQTDSKPSEQKLSQLKAQLLHLKRDEENNQILLQRLDLKLAEMRATFEKSDEALQKLINQVGDRQTKITFINLDVKYEQMKKKVQKFKTNNTYASSTAQKNMSKLRQQNKLLKNQIKQYSQEIEEIAIKITSIVEKSNSIIQLKKDILTKVKMANSNSVQFFTKSTKQSPIKLTPFDITKGIQLKPKEIQKRESEDQLTSNKHQISCNPVKNQTLNINVIQQEEQENQFLDINEGKSLDQVLQDKEKATNLTPKVSTISTQSKQVQNITKTTSLHQQQKITKNARRFLVKKRKNEQQQ